ncbi:MAG: hypothetical protein R8M11_09310 [Gallionella sp.]
MTNFAGVPNSMKPVWEYNRTHPLRLSVIVNDHITIFRNGYICKKKAANANY